MVNSCSANGCKNRSSPGISFFSFPADIRRSEWIKFANNGISWIPKQWNRICSQHFSPLSFENIPGIRKLKNSAVPSIIIRKDDEILQDLVIQDEKINDEPFPAGQNIIVENYNPSQPNIRFNEKISFQRFLELKHHSSTIDKTKDTRLPNNDDQSDEHDKDLLIKKLRMEIEKEKKTNKTLREDLRNVRQRSKRVIKKKEQTLVNLSKQSILKSVFNDDQIDLIHRRISKKNINGIRWSNKTIEKSLKYRFTCGGSGYEEIRKTIPLPSQRTLARKIENLKFDHGVLHEMLELLKFKVTEMTIQDRDCVIMTDEMSLEEGSDYDPSLKRLFGNVTFPKITTRKAKNGLVIMLAGIQSGWKVIVAYELTDNINNSEYGVELKKMILEIIEKAEDMGLRVHLNVNDMGPLNIKMWKQFDIKCKKIIGMEDINIDLKASIDHPNQTFARIHDPPRLLHFMADVPHLFKNICQSLINNRTFTITEELKIKYNLKSKTIDFTSFEDVFETQSAFKSSLMLAPKLEAFKLKPTNFEKMKVKTSFHVLHKDVSAALKVMADDLEESEQKDTYLSTAWFIDFINQWFYLMTSRSQKDGALDPRISENYGTALAFLKESIEVILNLSNLTIVF